MEEINIEVGRVYLGKAIGLKRYIIGEVIKKMERCCILYVKEHDGADAISVVDKASKVVAKYSDLITEV